ncbi:uncharacterized protein LOC124492271 isoform X2 [Dermatophagoides farinae]|uniref:uncharacterized protein LOC124492271 isoform X2 n=1 Tax=Dermatophagoides farinae TaxID=6954 RepID=UPI003F61F9EE
MGILINPNSSIIVVILSSSFLSIINESTAIHYGGHHRQKQQQQHHHHHHGTRHYPKCMHDDWHTNTPSLRSSTKIPFIWPHDITTLDSNHDHHDHHHHEELTPLRLEYTLPPVFDQRQIILNEEDIFEPHTDIQNTNKNTLMAPYQQFTSIPSSSSSSSSSQTSTSSSGWDDAPNSNIFRIEKISSNLKKKRKKIFDNSHNHHQQKPMMKQVYYPEILSPNYSKVNKIIVIEETDVTGDKHNNNNGSDLFIDSNVTKQIVQSILDSNRGFNDKNSNKNYQEKSNDYHRSEPTTQPLLLSTMIYDHPLRQSLPPISTIKDLHDRLNETLLLRNTDFGNVTIELANNNTGSDYYHNLTMITPYKSYNLSTITFQTNTSNDPSSMTFVNDQLTMKNTRWLPPPPPPPPRQTNQSIPINKSSDEQLVSSGSTNQEWLSSTVSPPVFYFTSERDAVLLPTPPTMVSTRPSTFYQRKSNSKSFHHHHNPRQQQEQHKNGDHFDTIKTNQQAELDIGKLGSIIIAFCISILMLIGIIVMFLHKDCFSNHFLPNNNVRNVQTSSSDNHENDNQPQSASFDNQQSTMESMNQSTADPTNQSPPAPAPPPPPPPPPAPAPKPSQHRIQQIMGIKSIGDFNDKKCTSMAS